MTMQLRVFIVDDEVAARADVRRLLNMHADVTIAGECDNGATAIEMIRHDTPDLVFLDVQMPQVSGFGVLQALSVDEMPMIIFITAYEEYAVRAFDAHAVDYLLKPYEDERFHTALERARKQLASTADDQNVRLEALQAFARGAVASMYPRVFAVRHLERYEVVRVEDIRWIEAEGTYVRLHLTTGSRLMRQPISAMESSLLDPAQFLRIHRSAIVNVSQIAAVEPISRAEYSVILLDGTRVTCSRGYRQKLRERVFFSG